MKSRARGLSLIEVVIGMALLGLFLASIFIAQARLTRQNVIARQKAVAISATDSLLASWALDWANFPTDDTGTIPEHDTLQWTTQPVDAAGFEELGITKVRLSITDSTLTNTDEPILQLELAVPIEEETQEETQEETAPSDDESDKMQTPDNQETSKEVSP